MIRKIYLDAYNKLVKILINYKLQYLSIHYIVDIVESCTLIIYILKYNAYKTHEHV